MKVRTNRYEGHDRMAYDNRKTIVLTVVPTVGPHRVRLSPDRKLKLSRQPSFACPTWRYVFSDRTDHQDQDHARHQVQTREGPGPGHPAGAWVPVSVA